MITKNGGTHLNFISGNCTHLVTTQGEIESHNLKAEEAKSGTTIHIVSLDWLLESIEQKKKLPELNYRLALNKAQTSGNGANGTNGTNGAAPDVKDKKRGRPDSDGVATPGEDNVKDDEPPAKKTKDTQETTKEINVRVDERCPLTSKSTYCFAAPTTASLPAYIPLFLGTHKVYIGDDGAIWDAALNQTNVGNNANKFYRLQIITDGKDFRTWSRWGRVGEAGQNAMLGNGDLNSAQTQFEKKFRDKSGLKWENKLDPPKKGKYTFVERDYEDSEDEDDNEDDPSAASGKGKTKGNGVEVIAPKSQLPQQIQSLMELIFNKELFAGALSNMNYDANKLPLGKLSKTTLKRGYSALKALADIIADPAIAQSEHGEDFMTAVARLTNEYYTLIPHSFGRDRPPTIQHQDRLKTEVDLLESLSDMNIANEIMTESRFPTGPDGLPMHILDSQFRALCMAEMTPLKNDSTEFIGLNDYFVGSHGETHQGYEVKEIFRIERTGENDRFKSSKFASVQNSDKRLLWHGSRCQNFGGILSQGLRIAPPEAPASGTMFGKGVYLADTSSKSAGYCNAYHSGGNALLLLCEAELGAPMLELTTANYQAASLCLDEGKVATWGKGLHGPTKWDDAFKIHQSLKGTKMPNSESVGPTNVSNAYLQYNEYIAYDVAQIRLRYLFRVKTV
ncbi:MAG: hypothetical protein M4579_005280 [Chaenotheca gracillima]|nr:MAG: hypothetical protein M4579_005280 [Chaenotheca gracillima]